MIFDHFIHKSLPKNLKLQKYPKIWGFSQKYKIFRYTTLGPFRPFSLINGHRILGVFNVFLAFLGVFQAFSRKWFFFENRYLSLKKFSYRKIFFKRCPHRWRMFWTFSGHFLMNIHENSSIWKWPPLKPPFRGVPWGGGCPFIRENGRNGKFFQNLKVWTLSFSKPCRKLFCETSLIF